MEELKTTIDMIRSLSQASRIKNKRNFADYLADRITQSTAESSLLAVVEKLSKLLDSDAGEVWQPTFAEFIKACGTTNAHSILCWLREYPRIAAMLCTLKKDEYIEVISEIEPPVSTHSCGSAIPAKLNDIKIKVTCLSPLAHGSDKKAGNATIFRRQQILSSSGSVLDLPYYAGNALRGQMRDLLADDLLMSLGLVPNKTNPPVNLWFFHTIYAGGALESDSATTKIIDKLLGANGALNGNGMHLMRDMLPSLSLLGAALGNRIVQGRIQVADLLPACQQWSNGNIDVSQLFEWIYLTRREDHESHQENSSMIANTETLKAGTVLFGGIDMDGHIQSIEKSALGLGLELLAVRGYLGAENRRGMGQVKIEYENCPDSATYKTFLTEKKQEIVDFLTGLGAINAHS